VSLFKQTFHFFVFWAFQTSLQQLYASGRYTLRSRILISSHYPMSRLAVCLRIALACNCLLPLSSLADDAVTYQCKPGPWGRIEYQTLYLSAPLALMDEFPMPDIQPNWCFPGGTADSVRGFLTQAGLDAPTVQRLLGDPNAHRDAEGVFTVYPSVAELEALKPDVRATIYRELAKSPLNSFYYAPVCIPADSFEEWLGTGNFPTDVSDMIRKFVYRDGDAVLFSDFRAVLSHAPSDSEAHRWVRALTRVRCVLAYLKVDGTDDLTALKRYWSTNFHRKDSLPMLEAVADMPGGGKLDLTHLFPPLPRRLVYSYITPDIERTGQTPNCHWTSLNFFNYTRQNIFLDLKLASSQVLEDYERVPEANTFGDVLFFVDDQGSAYHSCVFIADNLVYTKNGENVMMPWILTRLEDVKQIYLRKPGAKIVVYRHIWPEEDS